MTSLPKSTDRQLGLVIDLDICVGCHACAVSCKEWNSNFGAPLSDQDAYGMASGTWLNRIHGYELTRPAVDNVETPAQTVYFPRSCLHCHDAPCVTVCPTGASQKRKSDGIVLVKEDWCMGLRAVCLGLPLRGAGTGYGCRGDEKMHALCGAAG